MSDKGKPSFYKKVSKQFPKVFSAVEKLGKTLRTAGPLDEKTSHLIQLAAAAAGQSEGAVCSHTRRALQAGASPEEISHTLLLLVSTIGSRRLWPHVLVSEGTGKEIENKIIGSSKLRTEIKVESRAG